MRTVELPEHPLHHKRVETFRVHETLGENLLNYKYIKQKAPLSSVDAAKSSGIELQRSAQKGHIQIKQKQNVLPKRKSDIQG